MCSLFAVSTSGYYAWSNRGPSKRVQEDEIFLAYIKKSFQESRKTYGYRRVHDDLVDWGISCGKHRVTRLMKQHDIKPKMQRKFKVTTCSNHRFPIHENHLSQDFQAINLNERWVSDITYIPTQEGWLYLAAVMDLYSRRIIGWSMSSRMKESLVIKALSMAFHNRGNHQKQLLFHSDRGSQYAASNVQSLLKAKGVTVSMSRRGNCYDNAAMESFFHTLKTECVHHEIYRSRDEAKNSLFDYIEVFYNRRRKHSYLGYQSPEQYEQLALAS